MTNQGTDLNAHASPIRAPLTYSQQALWLLELIGEGNCTYNITWIFRISGSFNLNSFNKAFQYLVNRHASLRTIFATKSTGAIQIVLPEMAVQFPCFSLMDQSRDTQFTTLKKHFMQEGQTPFDLGTGPMFRGKIYQTAEDEHYFILCIHHIIIDGWSLGILLKELAHIYKQLQQGNTPDLPELPIEYTEFATEQVAEDLDILFESGFTYWQKQLASPLSKLELPTDFPRTSHPGQQGQRLFFTLPEAINDQISDVCKKEKVTPFIFLLTVFKLLLYRYTNQQDLMVGIPVANRSRNDLFNIIGFFVNTLVMRSDYSGNPLFKEILARERTTVFAGMRHMSVPLGQLVKRIHPDRNDGFSQLFQVMFVLQNIPLPEYSFGDDLELLPINIDYPDIPEFGWIQNDNGWSEFDLTLEITTHDNGIIGAFQYNSSLFKRDTIQRMQERFQRLLQAILADRNQNITAYDCLLPDEKTALHSWNSNRVDFPEDHHLLQRFSAQVQATPANTAVVFEEKSLSYLELEQQANQLAHFLQDNGVQPDTLIAVCLERSLEMVIALLGILKSGAAYVPIDPSYPEDRIAYMLSDCNAPFIITSEHLLGHITEGSARTICFDRDKEIITACPQTCPPDPSSPDNLAYIIYTSGSTGRPKGVMIQRKSLDNLMSWLLTDYPMGENDALLQKTPFSFDASIWEFYAPLLSGGRLVMALQDGHQDPQYLIKTIQKNHITVLQLVPALLGLLLEQKNISKCRSLRLVFCGGEALPKNLIHTFYDIFDTAHLYNLYGPTEATVNATCGLCSTDSEPVSIGNPITNCQAFILDKDLNVLPEGIPGELHLGGLGLARGYLNQPELTAQKFITLTDASFFTEPIRLYKTGDLAAWLPDGRLHYIGRTDHQIKLRGFRIELGEIEALLNQHPAIGLAVVNLFEDDGHRRLIAYYQLSDDQWLDKSDSSLTNELRKSLQQSLPEYMVPAHFVRLTSLPLSPSGKIDRQALPAPEEHHTATGYTAPRTETEQVLVRIFAEILGNETIGIHDNFFDLGGDSILTIQIVAKAQEMGLRFKPRDIFEQQSIAELVHVIVTAPAIEAEQGLVKGAIPLTPIQQSFFSREQINFNHYNQSVLLEVPATITPDILRQGLQQIIHHHDVLRLRFKTENKQWQQYHTDNAPPPEIFFENLSSCPKTEQEQTIAAKATALQASLNIGNGPIMQMALFDLGESRRLFWCIHHLVVDGVSWRILMQDLKSLCQHLMLGKNQPLQLPPKTSSFQAWSNKLQIYAKSPTLQEERVYWQHVSSSLPLPVDHENINTMAASHEYTISLETDLTRDLLEKVPKAYNTRINDILLTALMTTLASWTNQAGHNINLEGHGRVDLFDDIDLSRTVGWFTSLFPVSLELPDQRHHENNLKTIKEQLRQTPSDGIGYGILRYLTQNIQPATADILFNYLGRLDTGTESDNNFTLLLTGKGKESGNQGLRSHKIEINSMISQNRLHIIWSYSRDLYRDETIIKLARQYKEELESLITFCTLPEHHGSTPSDFPIATLDQQELDQILSQYPDHIDDIYPLSPMQQGMMFHTLLNAKSGDYFEQIHLLMHGNINKNLLRKSWEYLLDRHTILRTAFTHDMASQPLQVVQQHVSLPWTEYNWQDLDKTSQQERLEQLLNTERQQGFQLDHAPLMRCQLIQLDPTHYRFIWNHHHLLMDGWCLQILFQELMVTYASLMQDPENSNPIPTKPQPFRNYIDWLHNQDETEARTYWQHLLQGFDTPNAIPLPVVSQNPPVYKEYELHLSPRQTTDLMALSRNRRLTLNTLLQGAWALLLHQYSGDSDIIFGVTVSGRQASLPGIQSMLGLFINTLPLRVRDFNSDLITYLQHIQEQQQNNERYGHVSLADIQKSSDVQGYHALFETLLVFENFARTQEFGSEELFTITETTSREQTNYPLTLMAVPGDELLLKLFYDSSTFSTTAIQRMVAHLQIILTVFSTKTIQDVTQISLLTPSEKEQIRKWNQTSVPIPRDVTLMDLVEDQVTKNPQLPAIIFHNQTISYEQLDRLSNHLAHQLVEQGIHQDSLVVISLERSPEMIIAIMAILKAGGAYVPVDPDYPEDRIRYMLEDSRTEVILTSAEISERLPSYDAIHICLELAQMAEQPEPPAINRNPGNIAYMIYTSGSTGQPKGVCCGHTGVINLCDDFAKRAPVAPGMAHSFWTSLSFDVSVYEIFTSLLSGGCLHIVPQEIRGDGTAFCQWLSRKKINNTYIPPFMLPDFDLWLHEHPNDSSLIRMLVGVEPIEEKLLASFMQKIPGLQIINGYGPTEATVCSTLYSVDQNSSRKGRTPIGQAVQNSDLYVLNHALQPMPVGIPGELYIGGTGLARGYWQREDLTSQAFISNPFFMEGGSPRLYRTGDLVRWLDDGNLEFMGRLDHQVKVRGFRIELSEIESQITRSELVRDNVVVARNDGSGSKRLIAYVATGTTHNNQTISKKLQQILAEKLPEYMIPSMIIELETLPLTPSGKLDRKALPEPERPASIDYIAPESPMEIELAAILEKLLDITGIGIHDNFFDLGGHSLLTVRLLSRIKKQFQQEIGMDHFFKNPTIAGLILLLEAKQDGHEEVVPTDTVIDLQQEAVLDDDIKGSDQSPISLEQAENIFITGATGFVGAFLLKELLINTSATIHCLVRAEDIQKGKTRIREGLQFYKLWDPLEEQRIIPVLGDLAEEGLGITTAILQQLETEIDIIFHNGAFVHHMLPYSKLKAANVGGTRKILRLACTGKLKSVHFVSTLNVFSSSVGQETCAETTSTDQEQHFESRGYSASKWVSEKLISMAGERGIPVTIYRLGLVTGDSRTGACNGNDHLDLFIRSCIQLGYFPADMPPAHIIPVNILTAAIVHLARQNQPQGTNYHLFNPQPVPSDQILETYQKDNKGLQKIDAPQWFALVEETMETEKPLPLVPYLPMYKKFLQEYQQQEPGQQALYSCQQTMDILAHDNMHYPELSETSLNAYFQFLAERKLI